jgi:hypothetical protein
MSEKGIAFDDTERTNHELDRIIASPIWLHCLEMKRLEGCQLC